ncbi:YnbE-like lipoprotein [Sphingomonas sp. PP-CE-3G-477]|nr:YnbE family lipoprotein [Sphingomonas sp. PP-CE-3G-477]PTQ65262.1 YnbE-like lipoprotein [Sphingomonas sp. PP-CE-3G-477]
MTETGLKKLEQRPILQKMKRTIAIIGLTAALPGCINVSAPDKPIEINLNINVTQEVVYRLDGEAKSLIQQNPGIF